jgi:hypothetical protein
LAGFEVTLYGRFWVTPEAQLGLIPNSVLHFPNGQTKQKMVADKLVEVTLRP